MRQTQLFNVRPREDIAAQMELVKEILDEVIEEEKTGRPAKPKKTPPTLAEKPVPGVRLWGSDAKLACPTCDARTLEFCYRDQECYQLATELERLNPGQWELHVHNADFQQKYLIFMKYTNQAGKTVSSVKGGPVPSISMKASIALLGG